jgi:ribosome-binding factor A
MGNHTDTKRSRRSRRDQAPGVRGLRLEELIKEAMNLLLESEVNDPHLEGVRISAVNLSPNGARARLFFSMPPPDEHTHHARDVQAALQRATGFFRRELCDTLSLKRTPELCFSFDLAALGRPAGEV